MYNINVLKASLITWNGEDIMITRDDVAKLAGVSKSTVSRVLNSNGYVSSENRAKIEAAIKELGYTPNLIARGLKTKRSGQILFCASELTNPFYIEVYEGMEEYAKKVGYTIVVSSEFNLSTIQQRMFDGIVLSNIHDGHEDQLLSVEIPIVLTNYTSQTYKLSHIKINIEHGAFMAMSHLYNNGHRKIAYFTNVESDEDLRLKTYINFLRLNDISVDTELIFKSSKQSSAYEQGYSLAEEFIKKKNYATAVFAFNDAMAIGILSAFAKNNISVPDDISVIGFDDIRQSKFTYPALTTVEMPKYKLGAEIIKMLIQKIEGRTIHSSILETELIIRDSVKCIKL